MKVEIYNCPGTLAEGHSTYTTACRKRLFEGKKVSHILPYRSPQLSEEVTELFIENRKRISISGVQEKLSMVLEKNRLRLTHSGEQGTYILKPIPRDLKLVEQVPANEHLTMQIARQVYKINTAENALIFFQDGSPAYITRRFDIKSDGTKFGLEDFASLAGKTKDNAGPDFKYRYSYEEIAVLLREFVPAWRVEVEKLFAQILFNYLFHNGDAHLKNFSLIEVRDGDYLLSPVYDLINTRLHVADSDMALEDGLFSHDYETDSFAANGYYAYDDFLEFALKIGVQEKRAIRLLDTFRTANPEVEQLTQRSFLSEELKAQYLTLYRDRIKRLNYSFSGKL
ncbi:HipA domain-containing protein [Limibacter armeniacum]|uniref:type II toxin-antitoxin system HipA family toxin n=1 Tax=Limibacter armeniacum TaxID=466084 RepID=UPI002FE63214